MWIQLLASKQIEIRGVRQMFHAGDCIDIGKHDASLFISEGSAKPLSVKDYAGAVIGGAGVVTDDTATAQDRLGAYASQLQFSLDTYPSLEYQRTIIYNPSLVFSMPLLPIGLLMLDTWEIAAPLMDYRTLAKDIGSDEERERTKKEILDLRVPVYDTRLIFVRHTTETQRLFDHWRSDLENGDNSNLSFLRAVWKVKPFILPLPCTWVGCNVG